MIETSSLEIFKQNVYFPHDIGMVSNNAYLSIIVTNNCQKACVYCINSETDHKLELPIDKAIENIRKLVEKYSIKEAILLGGEPTLHSDLFTLLKKLRVESGLEVIRLTTNGIKLKNNEQFIKQLVDKDYGIQGLNISFHNEDFITIEELFWIMLVVNQYNPDIKVRINTNVWKGNHDTVETFIRFIQELYFVDEIRVSNIIPKDSFSVNLNNHEFVGLTIEEYNKFFNQLCVHYENDFTLIENKKTLGFVRYVLIPINPPLIINWNTSSSVSEQICENNIKTRQINTFKCLVDGDISLSWNTNNIIKL